MGGTKILLEVGEMRTGRWRPALARRYALADFPGMDAVLEVFLAEWKEARSPRARIVAGAIGVAGPVLGHCATLTNRPWRIDARVLAARFGIPRLVLLNDLAAAAHGLDLLARADFLTIQRGVAVPDAPRVILGVGTGLGVAYRVAQTVIPGEGGHVGFSPASEPQVELWRRLKRRHARVRAEDVACGGALERDGLELFCANLGNVAGDQALNVMARGGVFLCGGVIARIGPDFDKEAFCSAFAAKGAHASILMRIPVRAVVNEKIALWGAARAASGVV